MLDASLISGTPFRNPTAFRDLAGILELMHQALAETISRTTGKAVRKYELGSGQGESAWLDALTKQGQSECDALGIPGPSDYSEFSLQDPGEFSSFTFILSSDLARIKRAAGIN